MSLPSFQAAPPALTPKAEKTRLRIALTAEQLVSDLGLGAVSARMIARRANLRNNSALHYHFGTMEVLFEFLIRHRMGELDRFRSEIMRSLSPGKVWTAADLVEMICLPHFRLTGAGGQFPYAGFLCEYLPLRYPGGFPWVMISGEDTPTMMKFILDKLHELLPHLPAEMFQRRVANATLLFLNVLRGSNLLAATDTALHPDHPITRDTLAQAVGALTA